MQQTERDKLIARANLLAILTIGYNFVEDCFHGAGGADETLALFGFGVDSFIEVISAVGIWHMIRRIRNNQGGNLRFLRAAITVLLVVPFTL